MASKHPGIRSRGPNRWQLIVSTKDETTGGYRQVTETFRGNITEARVRRAQLVADVSRRHKGGPDVTLGEVLDRWLADVEAEGRAESTIYSYRCRVKAIKATPLAKVRLVKLRPRDLNAYYAELAERGFSANNVRHYHTTFSAALHHAMRLEWTDRNIAAAARPPKIVRTPIHPPSPEQVALLIAKARETEGPELALFLRLSSTIGARCGEICALRWSDLELVSAGSALVGHSISAVPGKAPTRKTTKTNRARRIDLDPATVEQVIAHMAAMRARSSEALVPLVEDPYLFSNAMSCGTPWRPDFVTHTFRMLVRSAEVTGVRLHDLRHFVASQLLAAGRPVTEVAYRLGHTSTQMTLNVYGHFIPSAGTESADVMAALLRT